MGQADELRAAGRGWHEEALSARHMDFSLRAMENRFQTRKCRVGSDLVSFAP